MTPIRGTGRRDSALHHDLALEWRVDAVIRLRLAMEDVQSSGPSPRLCGTQRDVYWPDRALPLRRRDPQRIEEALDAIIRPLATRSR